MSKQVSMYPGFKGFITGLVNADRKQRAFFEVKDTNGRTVASATFEGQGTRVYMKDVFNNRPHWSFGPFNYSARLYVTISNYNNGRWNVSKMIGPLEITKNPEPDYPITFHLATVVSEDGADQSYDDCTIKALQYKE